MSKCFFSKMIWGALFCVPVFSATAADFVRYDQFPSTQRYSVVGAALSDGRLLVWDGETVYAQPHAQVDAFLRVGTGYSGDPAFLIVSPNGHTALLGAGGYGADPYLDRIYRFDASAPSNFSEESVALTLPHYTAAFLTERLVLIDAGAGDWMNSVLSVYDLDGAKSAPVPVVYKPASKAPVVNKPGYSAAVGVDRLRGRVYAMDAATLELRSFSLTAMITAFEQGQLLDWASDGVRIGVPGQYFSGGVAGVTQEGRLLIDGALGWGLPGGVQVVDPVHGTILEVLDPTGSQAYARAIYNPGTRETTVMANGLTYVSGSFTTMPLGSWPVLGILMAMVMLGGVRFLRGRRAA